MASNVYIPLKSIFDDAGVKKAQRSISGLAKSVKSTLGVVGIGLGIGAIVGELKDATKAAVADTKAQALLAQQMRNTAGATNVQIAGTEQFIQKLQMQTAILDDQLRPAMASLVRATGDVTQAQNLLALATDVSAATGKDLESVALALGKAVSGQTTALFRMIPGLKGSSDWMAKLKQETNGAAAAAANTDPFARLNVIFNDIQEQIGMVLLPTLQDFANWFASPQGQAQVQEFVDVLIVGVKKLADFAKWVGENIGWLGPLATAIAGVTIAMTALNLVMNTNPIILMIGALAALANVLMTVFNNATDAGHAINNIPNSYFGRGSSQYARGVAPQYTNPGAGVNTNTLAGILAASGTATTQIKVADAVTKTTGAIKKLTTENTTLTKAVAAAKAAFDAQVKAYQAAVEAAQGVIDSTKEMMSGFTALFAITPKMGEFEQKVVDGFQSIFDTIKSTLADKRILQSSADSLTAYANSTLATLKSYAQQQDVLAQKIDIARTITGGVTGLANLTSMLETTTEQVTSVTRSMANGIETIMTKTFDVTKTGGIVDNFKALVDKTKAFATNLISLKKLGLNKNLFAQLVNAGADAGGATAQAIVDGGNDTIVALNDLYKELDLSAASIAETSTQTLYEVGQQIISNGFIAGLQSQSDALMAQAKMMADQFAAAFQGQMANALQVNLPQQPAQDLTFDTRRLGVSSQFANMLSSMGITGGGLGTLTANNRGGYTLEAPASVINLYLNAQGAIGLTGSQVAQQMIAEIKKYERSNGAVWVAA